MNQLETKPNNLPVPEDFWGDMEPKDFVIPRVSVGQPTSKKYVVGEFNYNSGHHTPTMLGVKLVVPKKTRVLYGKNHNDPSRCSSDNYSSPSARVKNPISTNCFTCPASQWGKDHMIKNSLFEELKDGKGNPNVPLCKETYNLLLADNDWNPFFMAFQGTQLKIISEKLFTKIKYEFDGVAPYAVQFDMGLSKNDTYYDLVLSNFQITEHPEVGQQMYSAYSKTIQDTLAKQHEDMDSEKVVTNDHMQDIITDSVPSWMDEEIPF